MMYKYDYMQYAGIERLDVPGPEEDCGDLQRRHRISQELNLVQ